MSCKFMHDDCRNEGIECDLCFTDGPGGQYIKMQAKKQKGLARRQQKADKRAGSSFEYRNHELNKSMLADTITSMTVNSGATVLEKGDEQMVIFGLNNAVPNITINEFSEETKKPKKKRIMICPEEWGDSFGEEFYDFSLDNAVFYSPKNVNLRISEKSRPVEGQISFNLLSEEEIMEIAENIKKKVGAENE